jgi:hypothetical protein
MVMLNKSTFLKTLSMFCLALFAGQASLLNLSCRVAPPPPKSSGIFPLERLTNQDRVVTPYTKEALKEFAMPGAPYRMNFLFHDYPKVQWVSPAQIIAEGGGGVVLNDVWDASYLQDDSSVTQLVTQVSRLKQAGANVWIYDEQIFPSGPAGGLVLTNNPEYVSLGLSQKIVTGGGATNLSWRRPASFERIVGAYALLEDGTRRRVAFDKDTVSWSGAEGKWSLHLFVVSPMYEHTPSQVCGLHNKMPNPLSAATTRKFIDVTFEFYKKHIPEFSGTVDAFFMDEPSLQELILNGKLPEDKISWADNVESYFYQMHGYEIALHYGSLFTGDTPNDMAVRCDYRETLAHLYAANFIGQMQAWAKKNNTLSSGHLTFEENIIWHVPAYGNLMTALKYMGAPGCDNLAATYKTFMNTNVGLWDAYNWSLAAVYAGSAARMAGKQGYVMVELCPTTDGQDGRFATKEDAFKIANLTFKSGVNHINSYGQLWNFKEGETNYFRQYADYTARLAYMLRKANYDSRVGIYYPIETIQGIWKARSETLQDFTDGKYGTKVQHALLDLVQGLWSAGWDGTLVDADSILLAKVEGKALVINGVAFEALILPYATIMKPEVLKKLLTWERAGGRLLFVGDLPRVATDPDRHEEVAALIKGRSLLSVSTALREAVSAVKDLMTHSGANIFLSRYDMGDRKMYFFINMNPAPQEIFFSHPQAKGFDLYDNMTGIVLSINGASGSYTIPANGSVFVVIY